MMGDRRDAGDVLKALALGADAVMIGRATLYGLGAGGEAGAARALAILDADIRRTMATMGCSRISELSRDHVVLPGDVPSSAPATHPMVRGRLAAE
jgi:(S)-mandelate dehydrogenase